MGIALIEFALRQCHTCIETARKIGNRLQHKACDKDDEIKDVDNNQMFIQSFLVLHDNLFLILRYKDKIKSDG